MNKRITVLLSLLPFFSFAQLQWSNVDSAFGPLPPSVHVFYTEQKIDTAPFRAFYLVADLKDKRLRFTSDTSRGRRLTPSEFFQKNERPLAVVNCTFFSFESNSNLNVVIKEGEVVAFNSKSIRSTKDSMVRLPVYSSAIGITKKRKADVAWIKTDSTRTSAEASQHPLTSWNTIRNNNKKQTSASGAKTGKFKKWKMQTAVGGGPVLLQNGAIKITNEEEKMFAGKGIKDKHPRTAMGYTADNKLIILVVEGRNPLASGATLPQEAQLLKDLGCVEALNLDGGGSSCLLINGKETIQPSDKKQRAVPAVFLIKAVPEN